MKYERNILIVLSEAGSKGLSLKRIALNIYNMHNSIFEPLEYDKVYGSVAQWLRQESMRSQGTVRKTEHWGHYTINKDSRKVQQLLAESHPVDVDEWMS